MKLWQILEAFGFGDEDEGLVNSKYFEIRRPGTIYRWMCIEELKNIYLGSWYLLSFDEYGEENHPEQFDDMYFKSFSTHLNDEQNDAFFDELLVAFDENGLEHLVPGSSLVDYEYEEDSKENEKRLIYPKEYLPKVPAKGKYWKLIQKIFIPQSELKTFSMKMLRRDPENPIKKYEIPSWAVIEDM